MQTKLHINLTQGIIDVEGDVELVRAVYEDFKDQLSGRYLPVPQSANKITVPAASDVPTTSAKLRRRPSSRKKANSTEGLDVGISADSPKLDKTIDTSRLEEFYGQFVPSSIPEKILIFLKYLTDEVGISIPNTDQVYTCFKQVKEKVPKAFAQAFRDAASKRGFIDFNSATDIKITILGDNHFNFQLKRKGAE
jgi:hypothetical protein